MGLARDGGAPRAGGTPNPGALLSRALLAPGPVPASPTWGTLLGDPRGPRAPSQDPALVLRTAAWVSFLLLLFVFAERQQPPRGLAGLPQNSPGRTVSLWEIHRPPPFDSPRRLSGPAWTRQQDREVVPHLRPSGQPRPARADSPPLPHAASFGAANLCSPWAGSTERTQSRPWQGPEWDVLWPISRPGGHPHPPPRIGLWGAEGACVRAESAFWLSRLRGLQSMLGLAGLLRPSPGLASASLSL